MDRIKITCNIFTKKMNDKSSPMLDLIDKNSVKTLIDTGGSSFKEPWFGQLMRGPQLLAYLIQVNTWLKEYNVKIEL